MAGHSWISSLSHISLLLLILSSSSLAAPNSPWMREARSRLAKSSQLSGSLSKRFTNGSCDTAGPEDFKAPKANVWSGLTDVEAASVTKWLFRMSGLNLTNSSKAGEWDNTLLLVELNVPNKTDVLPYIDGNASAPERWAHAVLDMRASEDPVLADILVGPLPIDSATTWMPLEYPYTKKSGGKTRNLDADSGLSYEFRCNISATIADITMDLWGGTAMCKKNDSLSIWGIDPVWQYDGRVTRWVQFWNYPTDEFDALTLLPLGLYFKTDETGRDPSAWKLEGWLYNDVFYPTTAEFRSAYFSANFTKLPPNVAGDWSGTDRRGSELPMDALPPPQAVRAGPARYSVDQEAKYVEWMDFSFYIGFTRDRGMALYDIRHKGQRILYELSLQEALAHYAGGDPTQSGTAYLDTFYGFGPYAFELVPGYDCPAYASYMNTSFYIDETTHTHINSICFFEFDADYPMQRHSTGTYVANTKNVYFTVRSVSTVGNYDYMFSYEFYLDGSIKVTVRASGYIQSAYFAANEDYGYQIHDALSGSMHDHVLNYKADFDILGKANSFQMTTFVPTMETYPWHDRPRNTMRVNRTMLKSESEGKIFYTGNGATQYRVVNTDKPNKYGEYRGYRILPSDGTCHLTVQNSSNLEAAVHPFTHDLYVLRQKDTEPRSCHPYNGFDVYDPMIDFSEFFEDDESLEQEDLVVYFNLGMHHLPHTGDLPNTVFTTAHSGVQFMPVNYYEGDVSRETRQMVRVDYGEGKKAEVKTFGQDEVKCELDMSSMEEGKDLSGYVGDVVIRKFPYDPNDPYFETDSIS
ncbi:uncharacterized protein LTR77_009326 [Saxophila tyrrhenica]|uniref:Amine oxidase n=1 Tax=Saxophila tyrrhenica TaxID=1690608 RepID=A0AAV9P2W3_9PEZI|nr:hypothetical protein LTR77_009326 [Saxophila tyrrhenica]